MVLNWPRWRDLLNRKWGSRLLIILLVVVLVGSMLFAYFTPLPTMDNNTLVLSYHEDANSTATEYNTVWYESYSVFQAPGGYDANGDDTIVVMHNNSTGEKMDVMYNSHVTNPVPSLMTPFDDSSLVNASGVAVWYPAAPPWLA